VTVTLALPEVGALLRWKRTPKFWFDFKPCLTTNDPNMGDLPEHAGLSMQRFMFLGPVIPLAAQGISIEKLLNRNYLFEFLWIDTGTKIYLPSMAMDKLKIVEYET
jgi:hypothetical protein